MRFYLIIYYNISLHYITLHNITLYYITIQQTVLYRLILLLHDIQSHYVKSYYIALQCGTFQIKSHHIIHGTISHFNDDMIFYSILPHSILLYYVMLNIHVFVSIYAFLDVP